MRAVPLVLTLAWLCGPAGGAAASPKAPMVMERTALLPVQSGSGSPAAVDLQEIRSAAERGEAEGQYQLGLAYETGTGVPQDAGQAAIFYFRAAEQNHARAARQLGSLYEQGVGVPQDFLLAKSFYEVAAGQGDSGAEVLLGGIYERGAGVPQDYQEAARHYELAADRGDPLGQALLGALYEQGLGFRRIIWQRRSSTCVRAWTHRRFHSSGSAASTRTGWASSRTSTWQGDFIDPPRS
jgi:TPR repeat protein